MNPVRCVWSGSYSCSRADVLDALIAVEAGSNL